MRATAMQDGERPECAKFNCHNPATHVLLIAADRALFVEGHYRCQRCGHADQRVRLVQKMDPTARTALVRLPAALLPRLVTR